MQKGEFVFKNFCKKKMLKQKTNTYKCWSWLESLLDLQLFYYFFIEFQNHHCESALSLIWLLIDNVYQFLRKKIYEKWQQEHHIKYY